MKRKKYVYKDATTLWIRKETVGRLRQIKKELEEKFKTQIDYERAIIELLDFYEQNAKKATAIQL